MGFFNEITNLFEEDELREAMFNVHVLGGVCAVVEGFKKIIMLSEGEIKLAVEGNRQVRLVGMKLYIKKLEPKEVVVAGKILGVEILEN